MKILAKCEHNLEVAKEASKFIFGQSNLTAAHNFWSMLPSAYMSGAYFVIRWHGYKFRVGYHVNGTIYLYVYNK